MKRYFKNIAYLLATTSLLFASCEDIDPLVEGLGNTARMFSPTDVEVRVVNNVNARVYWTDVKGAQSYNVAFFTDSLAQNLTAIDLESENFVKIAYDVAPTTSVTPYIAYSLPQAVGLTAYVQAVSSIEGTADSKWTPVYFKTSEENIFTESVAKGQEVTLTWPADSEATSIKATNVKTNEVVATHSLTTDELSAGSATITGLEFETEYEFSILNGKVVRGTVNVTTLPNGIPAGVDDNLAEIIAAANAGETILLADGLNTATSGKVLVDKQITIRAAAGASPILDCSFELNDGASLFITDVDFVLTHTNRFMEVKTNSAKAQEYGEFKVANSRISNLSNAFFDNSSSSQAYTMTNLIIDNVVVEGNQTTHPFIDIDSKGVIAGIQILNSTFTKCGGSGKQFVYLNGGGASATLTVKNNTIVGSLATVFSIKAVASFELTNTIFVCPVVETPCKLFNDATSQPGVASKNYALNYGSTGSGLVGILAAAPFAESPNTDGIYMITNTDITEAGDPDGLSN